MKFKVGDKVRIKNSYKGLAFKSSRPTDNEYKAGDHSEIVMFDGDWCILSYDGATNKRPTSFPSRIHFSEIELDQEYQLKKQFQTDLEEIISE